MDLRQLYYYCKLVEETSFRKAAIKLNISQSALSQQISALETELKVLLVRREGRRSFPTQAGLVLYRKSKIILELADVTKKELTSFNNTISGVLSISTNTMISVLSDTIKEFSTKYPSVLLDIREGSHELVIQDLMSGKSEIAVTDYDEIDDYIYNYFEIDLQRFKLVGSEKFIPDHTDVLQGSKLKKIPLIIYKTDIRIIRNYCIKRGFEPIIAAYVDSTESKIRIANMGIGVALGSESCADSGEKSGLNSAYLEGFEHKIRRCIFWKDDYSLSIAASEFLAMLKNASKKRRNFKVNESNIS